MTALVPGLVSVVVPCYNMAATIAETLTSALTQDHRPLQIIVVDDGSRDRGAQVAQELWQGRDWGPGLAWELVRQPNQGKPAALEAGITRARGEFLAILDADDVWLPASVSLRVEALRRQPGAVAVYADAHYMDQTGQVYKTRPSRPIRDCRQTVTSLISPIVGPTLLARAAAFRDMLPLDRSFVRSDDAYINMELCRRGPLVYLDLPVLKYRTYHRKSIYRLRLLTIKHDARLVTRYCRGLWWVRGMVNKVLGGLLKLVYEAASPNK